MSKISAIILTYNEELHIARALESLQQCPAIERIYIVDSYSTDRTRAIGASFGAQVVEHEFVNQARQFQWALENLPISTEWIMRLDADEVIGKDLAIELAASVSEAPSEIGGFTFNRRHIFLNRWIRHGGRFPLRLLRVWRRDNGYVEDRWMDEHIVIKNGKIKDLDGTFEDRNLNGVDFFTAKHNSYATREALEVLLKQYSVQQQVESGFTLPAQARLKRFLKEAIYNQLPYQVTSFSYFAFRYFFQLGFLDGSQGLAYHFLQGLWYRFLVGAKVEELRATLLDLPDDSARLAALNNIADELTPKNQASKRSSGTSNNHEG
jgi:glycosyltransferase involved in cell wall biosynthesis